MYLNSFEEHSCYFCTNSDYQEIEREWKQSGNLGKLRKTVQTVGSHENGLYEGHQMVYRLGCHQNVKILLKEIVKEKSIFLLLLLFYNLIDNKYNYWKITLILKIWKNFTLQFNKHNLFIYIK